MGSRKTQKIKEIRKAKGVRGYGANHPGGILEKISLPPLALLIILAAILVCYIHTLSFNFTRFDDDLIITNNIELYEDISKIGTSFTRDAFNRDTGYAFYRPVQNLSFFVDAQISGSSPIGFKVTNLLLHLLTCISLLYLFKLLHLDYRLSFLAVLIYSVHPLFNHAVIWIPSRGDLFIALFGAVSYIAFIKYCESNRIQYLFLHTILFFLAAFSKETAVLLPLLFILHAILFERPIKIGARHFLVVCSWIFIIGGYLYCRSQVIRASMKNEEFGIMPFISNLQTMPEFLSKFILPANLSVLPVFGPVSTLLGCVLLAFLAWRTACSLKTGKYIYLFGLCWFVVFTAVTMLYRHELGKAGYDYLEHRAYLPMIGILMALVMMVQEKLKEWDIRIIYASGLLITVVFAALTMIRSQSYKNPMAFYASAIRSNPQCAMAYYNRAKYKRSLGDRNGAITDYDDAIRVKPDFAEAYFNRGNARKEAGEVKGALLDYSDAIKWNGRFLRAYYNRGTVRLSQGDNDGAMEDFSRVLALNPKMVDALNNRGAAYYGLGQMELALAEFNRALEIDPKYVDAWRNRGLVKLKLRDAAGACADWQVGERNGSKEAAKLLQEHCR